MTFLAELMQFLTAPLAMDHVSLRSLLASLPQIASEIRVKKELPPVATLIAADGSQQEMMTPDSKIDTSQSFVAVIPLWGSLSMHGGWFSTSTRRFSQAATALDRAPNVTGIVFDVNSPGGTVSGTSEAAAAIQAIRSRGKTATVSVSNPMMASAATWIGTAAEKVYVTPSGEAGSIGVISVYEDMSGYLEKLGIKVDVIRTPDKKARFTGVEPLTDEMRDQMQRRNDAAYSSFVNAMAKNRGVGVDAVRESFGGGEMMTAKEAVDAGLADGIGTIDSVISQMSRSSERTRSQRAANVNRLALEGV